VRAFIITTTIATATRGESLGHEIFLLGLSQFLSRLGCANERTADQQGVFFIEKTRVDFIPFEREAARSTRRISSASQTRESPDPLLNRRANFRNVVLLLPLLLVPSARSRSDVDDNGVVLGFLVSVPFFVIFVSTRTRGRLFSVFLPLLPHPSPPLPPPILPRGAVFHRFAGVAPAKTVGL
jgi:hypothetical protein